MNITKKFSLSLVASSLAGLLLYTEVAANRQGARLDATVADDLVSLGQPLGASMAAVWERDGEARAEQLLDVRRPESPVRVRWLSLEGVEVESKSGPTSALAPRDIVEALRRGERPTRVDVHGDEARRLYAYVPVRGAGGRAAALELSRALASHSEMFWVSFRELLLPWALVAAFTGAVATALTTALVRRPLARTTARLNRIGAGDLSHTPADRCTSRHRSDDMSELERAVDAVCEELSGAKRHAEVATEQRITDLERLRQADKRDLISSIASGIAHELGTPLSVISLRAKMIASGEFARDEAPESARVIVAQAERLTKTVRQLLDFARRKRPEKVETDLGALIERTAQLHASLASRAQVRIATSCAGTVKAAIDPAQIEQALANLVVNGIQAMPAGGTLSIEAAIGTGPEDAISPETLLKPGATSADSHGDRHGDRSGRPRPETCAVLAVRDEGEGIPPDDIERVFEPFFATKGTGRGTGFGLATAHAIIQDHGGRVAVTSEAGKGSTFTLYLPF